MSAFCPDACPDADACVVGYPCARYPLAPAPDATEEDADE